MASAAGAASDDGGSARPHEETLDLDRDQPEAAGSAPPTVDGMDSGRGGQSVAAPAPGAGHNAVLAVAEPADRILAPPERTRLHPVQALAAPRRTAGTARIQIAAVGSAAAGHRLWRRMRQKNADVLHGLEATVERDESSAHAAVYRVEIGPMAQADARRTCDALQRRDVSCLVLHKATG